ncbi:hypothetical protein FGO68_gene13201 [Halteria grandinella]|uniref:Chromo domain-containing protein n=1 Tax=Halteria grandinella TaxID=5974 RepID=A0A8J8SXW4_HALGN|nr:hypothetical protein FGO68_gene13201 [Halteria grandinella]
MKRKTYKKVYQVESVVNKKFDAESQAYLYEIKWVGYPHSKNTWEPIEHLDNPDVQKMVTEFESRNQQIDGDLLRTCLLKKLTDFLIKHSPGEEGIQEIILSDFSNSSKQQFQQSNKDSNHGEQNGQFQKVLSTLN